MLNLTDLLNNEKWRIFKKANCAENIIGLSFGKQVGWLHAAFRIYVFFRMFQNLAEKRHSASFCHVNHYFANTLRHKLFASAFGSTVFGPRPLTVLTSPQPCLRSFNSFDKDVYRFIFYCSALQKTWLRKYLRELDRSIIKPGVHTEYRQSKYLG